MIITFGLLNLWTEHWPFCRRCFSIASNFWERLFVGWSTLIGLSVLTDLMSIQLWHRSFPICNHFSINIWLLHEGKFMMVGKHWVALVCDFVGFEFLLDVWKRRLIQLRPIIKSALFAEGLKLLVLSLWLLRLLMTFRNSWLHLWMKLSQW